MLPYTTISRATTSALTLARGPTVSLPSSSWIRPSTLPSTCRSPLPEISPFTCRLAFNRAVARSEVVLGERMGLVLMAVPSRGVESGPVVFVPGGVETPGVVGSSFFRRHMSPSWDQHTHEIRSEEHTSELQSQFHLVC